MSVSPLALAALVPMIVGPLPQENRGLSIPLCSGGVINLPIDGGKKDDHGDCHHEGCHAGTCRQKAKRSLS